MAAKQPYSPLGHPALHFMVAAIFGLLFTLPFLAFKTPVNTWTFLYGTWAVAIIALFFFSLGPDQQQEGDEEEDEEKENMGKKRR